MLKRPLLKLLVDVLLPTRPSDGIDEEAHQQGRNDVDGNSDEPQSCGLSGNSRELVRFSDTSTLYLMYYVASINYKLAHRKVRSRFVLLAAKLCVQAITLQHVLNLHPLAAR